MVKARASEPHRSGPDSAQIDPVIHRFEDAWRRGLTPTIEDFLPAAPADRLGLLWELVLADLEYRWKTKCPVALEQYLERFPDLTHDRQTTLELINAEFEVRQRLDPSVDFAEYSERFPQFRAELSSGLKTVLVPCQPAAFPETCPQCQHRLDPAAAEKGTCPQCGLVLPGNARRAEDGPGFPAFPDYEVLEELGRGSMGIVFKARQVSRDRLVALKVIRGELMASPLGVRRFQREAEAAARLGHPNVVGVYEAGRVGDKHFLAMEYLEGTNLQRLVETAGPLNPALACAMIRAAALGLQHAFEQGLVHRDIKPSNLMCVTGALVAEGPAGIGATVKVLDLGLARLHESYPHQAGGTLTQDGLVLGTPDYIAPEQAEDPRAADVRADLYSLGCTFYFLLTGRIPFPGGTLLQKIDSHRWKAPQPIPELRPETPKEVVAVVERLMAKDPADRFQTPAELADALEPLLGDEPGTGAVPPGTSVDSLGALDLETPTAPVGGPAVAPTFLRGESGALVGHADWVRCVSFSGSGRLGLSGSLDHTTIVWGLASGKPLRQFKIHTGAVLSLSFFPKARWAVSGGVDQMIRLWEVDSGKELHCFAGHTDYVLSVAVSADRRYILSGSADRTVRLWDVEGRELRRLEGHEGEVCSVAFAPHSSFVLSGSLDRSVRLWDAETGEEIRRFLGHTGPVSSVAISPDGKTALSGGGDRFILLWDLATGRELRGFAGHTGAVRSVAFAADGARVLSGSEDRTLRLWDVATGKELRRLEGHENAVLSVAFSPNGRYALSGSADTKARLWLLPP